MRYTDEELREFAVINIFPILETGDPNWDRPHAEAVVYHLIQILNNNPQYNLDRTVMILAGYLHDIGYSKFYKKGAALTREEYMLAKKQHEEIGSQISENILAKVDITSKQKQRILHLVSVHDKINTLTQIDELCFLEADTLGGLDVNFVKPTFSKEQNYKQIEDFKSMRFPKFITEYGKKEFGVLVDLRNKYYEEKA
jgi:hypothetical protein